jgi:UDP-N-acetylglucosamine pyrophosphorylase
MPFSPPWRRWREGERGQIPESTIEPVPELPALGSLPAAVGATGNLLNQLAVIELNGGLGTGLGLEQAKSLIRVTGENTFLDFIAKQILHLRTQSGAPKLAFYRMDSFSTQGDTLAYLKKYPEMVVGGELDFLQSKVPKLDAKTLLPVTWSFTRPRVFGMKATKHSRSGPKQGWAAM